MDQLSFSYEDFRIKTFNHWVLFLHECQCYVGRVYLVAPYTKAIDFIDLGQKERDEFFEVAQSVKRALDPLFKPDKMNYAALSNVFQKIHVHLIPRYKTPRFFEGVTFYDERWGQNYAPYNKTFSIHKDILKKLKKNIENNL